MGAWYSFHSGKKGITDLQAAKLQQLDLRDIAGDKAVPLNTLLKEVPDERKADLIAVCLASGSNRAYVLRVQVKLGASRSRWADEAKRLADGTEALELLGRAKNVAGVELVHVPVWMAPLATESHAAMIESAGVRVVRGQEFWDMQIPHVQAIAWLMPRTGAVEPS